MRGKRPLLPILAVCVASLGEVRSADALSIAITATANATTSSSAGPAAERAGTQSLAVTSAGGSTPDAVGATVAAATRYVSNAAADRPIASSGGDARWTWNTDYTITFLVTPDNPNSLYEIVVRTRIFGELTVFGDHNSPAGPQARVSDVIGYLDASPVAGLGLASAWNLHTTVALNDAQEWQVARGNFLNLGTFSGPQSFTLRFTFQTEAISPQSVTGGNEAAARFGASGPLSGATADDYPGPGDVVDRTQSLDGHFVTIESKVLAIVPEPGSLALFGSGLAGLALFRRNKTSV